MSYVISNLVLELDSVSNVASLARLVSAAEEDNDDLSTAGEVQSVAGAVIHSQFGDSPFNRLPVSEAARLDLSQGRNNSNLRLDVAQSIEPRDELFGLSNDEHSDTCIQVATGRQDC